MVDFFRLKQTRLDLKRTHDPDLQPASPLSKCALASHASRSTRLWACGRPTRNWNLTDTFCVARPARSYARCPHRSAPPPINSSGRYPPPGMGMHTGQQALSPEGLCFPFRVARIPGRAGLVAGECTRHGEHRERGVTSASRVLICCRTREVRAVGSPSVRSWSVARRGCAVRTNSQVSISFQPGIPHRPHKRFSSNTWSARSRMAA
jgi:hypothetical protein